MNIMDAMSKAPLVDFGWPSHVQSLKSNTSSNGNLNSAPSRVVKNNLHVSNSSMETPVVLKNNLRMSNRSSLDNTTADSEGTGVIITKWKIHSSKTNITALTNSSTATQGKKMKYIFGGYIDLNEEEKILSEILH